MDLVVSQDPKRESADKKKLVNCGKIEGLLDYAMSNASAHNTDGKRHVRTNNPENKEAYAVWTDIPAIVDQLRASSTNSLYVLVFVHDGATSSDAPLSLLA